MFSKLSGKVVTDEALRDPVVDLLIEARSIETFDLRRNAKLQSEQYLFAERYPYLAFASSDGCRTSSGMIKELTGELTVREKRQPITLLVNLSEHRTYRKKPAALVRLFGTVSRSALGLGDMDGEIGDEIHLNAEIFSCQRRGRLIRNAGISSTSIKKWRNKVIFMTSFLHKSLFFSKLFVGILLAIFSVGGKNDYGPRCQINA